MGITLGRDNVCYVHLTLVPYIAAAGEMKTKPTQHSVKELREIGIQPDVVLCRADRPISESDRRKIALFTNLTPDAVIPALVPIRSTRSRRAQRRVDAIVCQNHIDRSGRPSNWNKLSRRARAPGARGASAWSANSDMRNRPVAVEELTHAGSIREARCNRYVVRGREARRHRLPEREDAYPVRVVSESAASRQDRRDSYGAKKESPTRHLLGMQLAVVNMRALAG